MPQGQEHWGSDGIAAMLRALDIPYLALNPGASYRGLHDSIVNYLGNEKPQMLLCLHEEAAVAIAHGYARTSGRMMGGPIVWQRRSRISTSASSARRKWATMWRATGPVASASGCCH